MKKLLFSEKRFIYMTPPGEAPRPREVPNILPTADAKSFAKEFLHGFKNKKEAKNYLKANFTQQKAKVEQFLKNSPNINKKIQKGTINILGEIGPSTTAYSFNGKKINLDKLATQLSSMLSERSTLVQLVKEVREEKKTAKNILKLLRKKRNKKVFRAKFLQYLVNEKKDSSFLRETSHERRQGYMKKFIATSKEIPGFIAGKVMNILFKFMKREFMSVKRLKKMQKEIAGMKSQQTTERATASTSFKENNSWPSRKAAKIASKFYKKSLQKAADKAKTIVGQVNEGKTINAGTVKNKLNKIIAPGAYIAEMNSLFSIDADDIKFNGPAAWPTINTKAKRNELESKMVKAIS